MKKRILVMLLTLSLFATIFVGCNSGDVTDAIQSSTKKSSGSSSSSDVVSRENQTKKEAIPTSLADDTETTFNRIISTPRMRATPEEKSCMEYIKSQLEIFNYTTTVQEFPIHERSDKKFNWDMYNLKPEGSEFVGTGNNLIAEKNYYFLCTLRYHKRLNRRSR